MADTLVLGGGLAGSAAAILQARAGRSVTLVERETGPHHKTCGEFLSIEARDHLAALGLDPLVLGGTPIDHVEVIAGSRRVRSALPFTALGLSRFRLDEALLNLASAAGVDVRRGVRVKGMDGRTVRTSDGDITAGTILLATGKHRIPGAGSDQHGGNDPFVGFKMHFRLSPQARRRLDGTIRLILFDGGYAGLQMIEDDMANLCLVIRKDRLGELGGNWDAVLGMIASLPHCRNWIADAEPLMPRPATIANLAYGVVVRPALRDGVFPLGDLAGMTASLTGDGMALALRSGFVVDRCLARGGTVQDYAASHAQEVHGQIRRAMAIQHLQERSLLRMAGLGVLSVFPGLLGRLAQATRLRRWP